MVPEKAFNYAVMIVFECKIEGPNSIQDLLGSKKILCGIKANMVRTVRDVLSD
jgi:hypothetical protein